MLGELFAESITIVDGTAHDDAETEARDSMRAGRSWWIRHVAVGGLGLRAETIVEEVVVALADAVVAVDSRDGVVVEHTREKRGIGLNGEDRRGAYVEMRP